VQGLTSDGDVLIAPQLTSSGGADCLGSLEQALLLARASQVIKVRVRCFRVHGCGPLPALAAS